MLLPCSSNRFFFFFCSMLTKSSRIKLCSQFWMHNSDSDSCFSLLVLNAWFSVFCTSLQLWHALSSPRRSSVPWRVTASSSWIRSHSLATKVIAWQAVISGCVCRAETGPANSQHVQVSNRQFLYTGSYCTLALVVFVYLFVCLFICLCVCVYTWICVCTWAR